MEEFSGGNEMLCEQNITKYFHYQGAKDPKCFKIRQYDKLSKHEIILYTLTKIVYRSCQLCLAVEESKSFRSSSGTEEKSE